MKALAEQIADIDAVNIYGRVVGVRGLMVEVAGPIHAMSVGARVVIETGADRFIPCEVIGFAGNNAVLMPFGSLDGVRRGCRAVIANAAGQVRPSVAWLAHRVDDTAEPGHRRPHLARGVGDHGPAAATDAVEVAERHQHGVVAGEADHLARDETVRPGLDHHARADRHGMDLSLIHISEPTRPY